MDVKITHDTHENYAPLIEYGGEQVAALRWSSNGIGVRFCTGAEVLVSEEAQFFCGIAVTRLHDFPGIIYGEWVTARKARFG